MYLYMALLIKGELRI